MCGILAYYHLDAGPEPVKIKLDEGSPEALEVVFKILHFKHDCDVSHHLNMPCDLLYQIAKVANAYGLNKTLGFWKDVWISNQEVTGKKKLCLLLLFSNRKGFREEYLNMILSGEGGSGDNREEGDLAWDLGILQEVPGMICILPHYDPRSSS